MERTNHMQTVFEDISPKGGPEETETFMYDPPAEAESLGSIAVFLDTSTLPDALQYFGALIAGSFRRSYYAGNKSMQRSFAGALRAVNDTLAEEARSGTGQWIGMLRALVVTTDGSSLMMATTGGIEAHLTRQGQTIEIPLEAGEGTRPFGSYTEGELRPKDVLLIGRRGSADAHNIQSLLNTNTAKAVRHLRKSGTGALLMQANGERPRSEARRSGGGRATSSVYLAAFASLWSIIRRGGGSLVRGMLFAKDSTWDAVQALIAKRKKRHELPLPDETKSAGKETPKEEERETGQDKSEAASPNTAAKSAPPDQKGSPRAVRSRLASLPRQAISRIAMPDIRSLFSGVRTRRYVVVGAAFLLLIGAGFFSLTTHQQQAQEHEQIANALAAAQEALERGETQIILGDTEAAVDAFSQGLFILEDVSGGEMLRGELQERRNALQGILVAPVTPLLSFSGFPVGIEATYLAATTHAGEGAEDPLALAGQSHPAVWLNDSPKPTDGTFAVLPLDFRTGIRDLEVYRTGTYAVLTQEGVALIDAVSRNVTEQFVNPENPYRLLGLDSDSAFLLTADHTIDALQLPDADDEEGAPETAPWLIYADSRLEGATDMISVGGEPYVLLDDNTFLRFRRGRSTIRYTVEGFDWEGTAAAFAPLGEEHLLVLDSTNGRILLCELNGDIIEQYLLPDAEAYYDLTPGNTDDSVLILTDEHILLLELPKTESEETEG